MYVWWLFVEKLCVSDYFLYSQISGFYKKSPIQWLTCYPNIEVRNLQHTDLCFDYCYLVHIIHQEKTENILQKLSKIEEKLFFFLFKIRNILNMLKKKVAGTFIISAILVFAYIKTFWSIGAMRSMWLIPWFLAFVWQPSYLWLP